ncbi:MAG: hypothetical protein V7K18_29265 [Nostoc sp.]|uniref:hypothetical protein n=1 Tax=Nostoc sp. TaxID=1180 RepID=UPI002FFBFEC4
MSKVQQLFFQADGEIEQIEINVTATEITQEIEEDDDGIEYKDVRTDAIARMQQAKPNDSLLYYLCSECF